MDIFLYIFFFFEPKSQLGFYYNYTQLQLCPFALKLIGYHNVMAICFDTTASNTSTSIGACAILEQKLNRNLLHFACRHHIMELLAATAFKVTVEPTTTGPTNSLFAKFPSTYKGPS